MADKKTYNVKTNEWGIAPYPLNQNEAYMNEQQERHFTAILTAWKQHLTQEVEDIVAHLKQEHVSFADPADQANQDEEFRLELSVRDRERLLISKIDNALDALRQHIYGYCEECGAEIGIRRLEARPTARKCIDCKTLEEQRDRHSSM